MPHKGKNCFSPSAFVDGLNFFVFSHKEPFFRSLLPLQNFLLHKVDHNGGVEHHCITGIDISALKTAIDAAVFLNNILTADVFGESVHKKSHSLFCRGLNVVKKKCGLFFYIDFCLRKT